MSLLKYWTFDADGNGEWYILDHRVPFQLDAYGGFGSGTVTLQASADQGQNAYSVTGVSLTNDGNSGPLGGVRGDWVRPVVAGSTNPTLTVRLSETITRI